MAAIFDMDVVQDIIIFDMCSSKEYMGTKGMELTPTASCPKCNAISRCPSLYRRWKVLCFLPAMVSAPGLLLSDMLNYQIVIELLSII